MKVLRVADVQRSSTAGTSGVILRSGEELQRLGHGISYLFRNELVGDRCPQRLRRFAVPIAVCLRVYRRNRRQPLDVVEVHEPIAGLYSYLASTRWGRSRLPRCVVMSQGLEERCWQSLLQCRAQARVRTSPWSRVSVPATLLVQARIGIRHAAQVVVPNQANYDYLVGTGVLAADRVSVVPNGVEPGLFSVERRPSDHLRVLFLGSWLERKGVAELTQAWAATHLRCPSARLTVGGVGTTAVLDAFPAACRGSVTAIPAFDRADLPSLLARHDVLVLPSWYEGMPLVALEAAAAGLAVVATAIPGIVDIFRPPCPGDDGADLVGCVRPEELSSALGVLADQPSVLFARQAAARRRAAQFPWALSAQRFAVAYERAVHSA